MTDYVKEFIYPALEELREDLDNPESLILEPEAYLFGSRSALSSIDLVNLLVNLEMALEDKLGVSVTIANEKAMSRKNSPFRTIQTLGDYLNELVKENQNG